MKRVNYFKAEDKTHRSEYGRREQKWRWLRKMKRKHNISKKEFLKAAYDIRLLSKLPIMDLRRSSYTMGTMYMGRSGLPNRGDQSGWQP